MGTELTTVTHKDIQTIDDQRKVDQLIKPLVNEIHLFDSYIAGTTFLEDASVLKKIKVGDTLILRREDNRYDANAILMLTQENEKLGYVPEKDNIVFARLLDAGKCLGAKIISITEKHAFTQIAVGIYLVDF